MQDPSTSQAGTNKSSIDSGLNGDRHDMLHPPNQLPVGACLHKLTNAPDDGTLAVHAKGETVPLSLLVDCLFALPGAD